MTSTVFTVFMPIALGLVMFGLGLTLTVADFARVLKYPKAAAVALTCQLVVLPRSVTAWLSRSAWRARWRWG